MVGLCVNARGAWPATDEIAELGLPGQWIRSICYDLDEFDAAIQQTPANVLVCALLNSETEDVGNIYQNWLPVVRRFAERFSGRVGAVECGNELDLLGVPVQVAIRLVREASAVLREHGMLVVASSVAGPNWPSYIEQLGAGVQGYADIQALHPYGQRSNGFPAGWGFGELQEVIPTARQLSGLPIALTEFGIKVGDAGGENAQAIYLEQADNVLGAMPPDVLKFYCLFCLTDVMGSPGETGDQGFGLKRQSGSHRPSWGTFARLNHGPKPIEPPMPTPTEKPRYQHGFEMMVALLRGAGIEPGEPRENEWGPWPKQQLQLAEHGILIWCDIAGEGGRISYMHEDGRRFRFREDWDGVEEMHEGDER